MIDSRSIDSTESEIRAGLPHETDRFAEAIENLDYYRGDFDKWRYLILGRTDRDASRVYRTSRFMTFATNILTSHLYKKGPVRTVQGSPEATAALQKIYKYNCMLQKWRAADVHSLINQVAAFQVAGTPDPKNPIKIHLWDATSFAVVESPDDCNAVEAVITKRCYDNTITYDLWTDEEHRVYQSDKLRPGQTAGGRVARLIHEEANPYGVLNFSFVHYQPPTTCFWGGGPGTGLRRINDDLLTNLTMLADANRYLGKPKGFLIGTKPGWGPSREILPGEFQSVPAVVQDTDDKPVLPEIKYLEADLDYVIRAWDDINNYRTMGLEEHGIPLQAVRMVATAGRSGESIKTEQLPIVEWAMGRQPAFATYEESLISVVFKVLQAHTAGTSSYPDWIEGVLVDLEVSLHWSDLFLDLPGDARDRHDDRRLRLGWASNLMLIQEREKKTREEAIAQLEQVAEDRRVEIGIFAGLPPVAIDPVPLASEVVPEEDYSSDNTQINEG